MEKLIQVKNHNGIPVALSRGISINFDKEHPKVLRKIDNMILENPKLASLEYFIETSYRSDTSKRAYKEYLVTRDGFSLLVMGFTGAKALIKARTRKVSTICGGRDSYTYKDKSFRGKVYQDLSRNVKSIYAINEYDAIPRKKFSEAMEIIENYELPIHLKYEREKIVDSMHNAQFTIHN